MTIPLVELGRSTTALPDDALRRLQRLAASWQLLSDLCFSDLLMLVATGADPDEAAAFVVLAQVRPMTGQTLYTAELIGAVVDASERPMVARAWRRGEVAGGETTVLRGTDRARVQCIPVRNADRVIAVVTRESALTSGRRSGELERRYLDVFDRLATMVARGTFPFTGDDVELEEAPRVADGLLVLDGEQRIAFASPNAIGSLHRMGLHGYAPGTRLRELGLDPSVADEARRQRGPVTAEVSRGDASILLKAVPLLDDREVTGIVVLVRDVTDLRRRDRILLSKDATIREVHHRVKNSLQTIAALLRMQARRLQSSEARDALAESERRIRSIALVHETLSRDVGDVVSFGDVVRPLVRVAEEAISRDDLRLHVEVLGDVGDLPGDVATPLAVVLNELLQNAVQHAFPPASGRRSGSLRLRLERDDRELRIEVADDGIGLRDGFSLDSSAGLGLSIVQTLVTSELGGSIEMRDDAGTAVVLRVPLPGGAESSTGRDGGVPEGDR